SLPTPGRPGCPGCPGRPDCSGRPSCSHPLLPRLLAHLTALALWSLHRGKSGQSAISPRLRDLKRRRSAQPQRTHPSSHHRHHDGAPRQRCTHSGVGAPSWSRRKRSRGRIPAAVARRVEPQLMAAVASGAGTERTVSSARSHRSARSRRQAIIPSPPIAYATIIAYHRLNRYSVAYQGKRMTMHSATLAINEALQTKKAAGEKVLHLGFGEAGLPVPEDVVTRLQSAARENSYGAVIGSSEARTEAAGWFTRRNAPTRPEQIIFAPGSKPLLYALLAVLEGD